MTATGRTNGTSKAGSGKGTGSGDKPKDQGPSQAQILVEIAEKRFRMLMGADGQPYAVLIDGPAVVMPLSKGGGLRTRLAKLYTDHTGGKVPTSSALSDALTVLIGRAEECDPEPVELRVGRLASGAIVIDLGTVEGHAVVVEPGTWRLVQRSPLLFRRSQVMRKLPIPVEPGTGTLDGFRALLNVGDEGWQLVVGWLVAALIPDIPHPMVVLSGLAGAGKSDATKMLVRLIDDTHTPTRAIPKDGLDGWGITAYAHWVIGLDNLSTIPAWFSDALCRTVTGEGIEKRSLYTDMDVTALSFMRPMVANGIEMGDPAGDLAERSIPIELERIAPEARRKETDVWADFAAAHPAALGALLDLLAKVLHKLPTIKLDRLPRMADFAEVLAALDAVTGWDSLSAYERAVSSANEAVVTSDVLATAVVALAEQHGTWAGSASQLWDQLTPRDPFGKPAPADKSWPKSPAALSGKLKRVIPALASEDVAISFERDTGHGRGRSIRITTGPSFWGKRASDASDASDAWHQPSSNPRPASDDVPQSASDARPTASETPSDTRPHSDRSDALSDGADEVRRQCHNAPSDASRRSQPVADASDASDDESRPTSKPDPPLCAGCGEPMDPVWISEGFTTHPGCDPEEIPIRLPAPRRRERANDPS